MEHPADESIVPVCLVPNSSRQQHFVDLISLQFHHTSKSDIV